MILPIVEFLVMLNPFALFLYLEPIRKQLSHQDFIRVVFKSTIISLSICFLFFLFGDTIFRDILQINFESFRIFGGIIIFSYAFYFIVRGQKALITMKEDLDDLASEIALPFMVGAGTISLSILLSERLEYGMGAVALISVFAINFLTIYLMKKFRDSIEKKKFRTVFDKNMEILLRLNGLFIGSIGVNMVITGILAVF